MSQPQKRIGVVLLAAGLSRRMGSENKLLLPLAGVPIIRQVASAILDANLGPTVVVTGHEHRQVEPTLAGLPVETLFNRDFETGQMSSVQAGCGVLADRTDIDGIMIALGDMPKLAPTDYRELASAFFLAGANQIIVPHYREERGNPIIIPMRLVPDIVDGGLNAGCRKLVAERPDEVQIVAVNRRAFVEDIDQPEDLRSLTP